MYKYKAFLEMDDLVNYLNEHNINRQNIIQIMVHDGKFFPYRLIYWEDRR